MVLSFSITLILHDYESNPEIFYSVPLTTDVSDSCVWWSADENNYDKEVYNGDIGIIISINVQDQELTIDFYDKAVTFDYTDLDQISLAYATTIHKSQGSEYPAVIIPITMQSYMMLRRNLIYTGITRGKKLVVLIGQKKALAMAVRDNKGSRRYSKLREWLQIAI